MTNNLHIALLPMNIAWADVEENLYRLRKAVDELPSNLDVLVLPEMFATGFITDAEFLAQLAESPARRRITDALKEIASERRIAVCGTMAWTDGRGKFYNRAVFIEPDGEETVYNKRHLFSLGGEATAYAPGTAPMPVVHYRGWDIALAVCYDLRFPVWLRNSPVRYDLLLLPANWPKSRAHAWHTLLAARAIENQAYVAGCNRVGSDDNGEYGDTSAVYDPRGRQVAFDSDASPLLVTLDAEALSEVRRRFPFLNDSDNFALV